MLPTRNGAFHFFRALGVDVFIHWSWFVFAVIELQWRRDQYSSYVWNVWEYLGLFGLVLLHEYGHSLACRQVGGKADQIILWPLGGVAYVSPPNRPGAHLWSIAAGPLVNLVLLVLSTAAYLYMKSAGTLPWGDPNWWRCVKAIYFINLGLLIFNILPIYPLDGGKIFRSLLWFVFGPGKSLLIAAGVGFVGAAALALLAISKQMWWLGVMTLFLFSNCSVAWKGALQMMQMAKAPRRNGLSCPKCQAVPPQGALWRCVRCQESFDIFANFAKCPNCQAQYAEIPCLECYNWSSVEKWEGRTARPEASGYPPPFVPSDGRSAHE